MNTQLKDKRSEQWSEDIQDKVLHSEEAYESTQGK